MELRNELLLIKELARQIILTVEKMDYTPTLIKSLGLSSRAKNCLDRMNIKYLEDLLKLEKSEIMRGRNVGKVVFDEINGKVKSLGLRGWE